MMRDLVEGGWWNLASQFVLDLRGDVWRDGVSRVWLACRSSLGGAMGGILPVDVRHAPTPLLGRLAIVGRVRVGFGCNGVFWLGAALRGDGALVLLVLVRMMAVHRCTSIAGYACRPRLATTPTHYYRGMHGR